jgi:hypothetical protein
VVGAAHQAPAGGQRGGRPGQRPPAPDQRDQVLAKGGLQPLAGRRGEHRAATSRRQRGGERRRSPADDPVDDAHHVALSVLLDDLL